MSGNNNIAGEQVLYRDYGLRVVELAAPFNASQGAVPAADPVTAAPVIEFSNYGLNLTASFDDVTDMTNCGPGRAEVAIQGCGVHSVKISEENKAKLEAHLAKRSPV